ncbi:death ligand signal enhancer [Ambystoma mexicanum]|uniref:death ligand signal enhancer n=1 Tax=Ambystoma mexicanum TaxID=8296 RepID=UPI0037E85035
MWRVKVLLGRVLHRFHAGNVVPNTLYPAPAPHTEVEALNSTASLPFGSSPNGKSFHSFNSQNRQDGSGHGRERTFRPFRLLPQCSTLDALGWGALAAVCLHLSKQIKLRDSAPNSNRKEGRSWPAYLDGLLDSVLRCQGYSPQQYILPNEPRGIHLDGSQPLGGDQSYSSTATSLPGESTSFSGKESDSISSEEDESEFTSGSTSASETGDIWTAQNCEADVEPSLSLEDAASKLKEVSQNSAALMLNILGIGSARDNGDYSTAFTYFHTAASRGYSKAQYNTGVCYEQGNGVPKDLEKAAVYYHLAASNGHRMAQYRYARYLLHHTPGLKAAQQQQALEMLEQAAKAGLKQAQAYLGVFYTKDPHLDPQKAVKYLSQAAEQGDALSRFHLGVCHESGFGVPLNVPEAVKHYEKAALSGHQPAQEMLSTFYRKQMNDLMLHRRQHLLKTVSSCPCLSSMDGVSTEFLSPRLPKPNFSWDPALNANCSALSLTNSQSTSSLSKLADQAPYIKASPVYLGPQSLSAPRAIGVG